MSMEKNLVQPIIVAKTGSHLETVEVAAQASVLASVNCSIAEEARYAEWLTGPFTKTVRRASLSEMQKVYTWAVDNGWIPSLVHASTDLDSAVALPPMEYSEFPKILSRLQVSGTDFPRKEKESFSSPARVMLLDSLTTGKAAAQAAHAAWLWRLKADPKVVQEWLEEGCQVAVELASADKLQSLESAGHWSIRDNGLTEIEAHTLTAVALID